MRVSDRPMPKRRFARSTDHLYASSERGALGAAKEE